MLKQSTALPVNEQLKVTTTGTVQVRNNIDVVPQVSGRVVWRSMRALKTGVCLMLKPCLFKIEPA